MAIPHPRPSEPLEPEPLDFDQDEEIYQLTYRQGNVPNLTKQFYFTGGLLGARARAETHCRLMGLGFVYCRPFITDLDLEEKRRAGASR